MSRAMHSHAALLTRHQPLDEIEAHWVPYSSSLLEDYAGLPDPTAKPNCNQNPAPDQPLRGSSFLGPEECER